MSNYSGVAMQHIFCSGVMDFPVMTTGFCYPSTPAKKMRREWINNPAKDGGSYINQLGREDPIYEMIDGRMVPYVRRYIEIEEIETPSEPRANILPAPKPRGVKKETRRGGFGANQKKKIKN